MKIYITASFRGADNKVEIEQLCALVRQAGFEDFCFVRDVEHYQKVFDNPRELMQRALEEIKKCDALLIDVTEKSTGRSYEAGMAFALQKKVIALVKKGAMVKDTTKGIASEIVEYETVEDIAPRLQAASAKWHDIRFV